MISILSTGGKGTKVIPPGSIGKLLKNTELHHITEKALNFSMHNNRLILDEMRKL